MKEPFKEDQKLFLASKINPDVLVTTVFLLFCGFGVC